MISPRQHWCRLIIYPNFTKILEPKHWTDLWKTKNLRVTNEICACSLISHFFFNYQRWNTKTVISNLNLNIKMIFWNQQILKGTCFQVHILFLDFTKVTLHNTQIVFICFIFGLGEALQLIHCLKQAFFLSSPLISLYFKASFHLVAFADLNTRWM